MMDGEISDTMLRSIRRIAFAVDQFEPFPRAIVPEPMLRRLLEAGLVEAGRSCRPAVDAVGYRLTDEGWRIARAHWTSSEEALCA